jgi:hypothetical protein
MQLDDRHTKEEGRMNIEEKQWTYSCPETCFGQVIDQFLFVDGLGR